MKKILFLSLLGLPILFLGGCSLINKNDVGINNGDLEKISQLEQQLSGLMEQISGLQEENETLESNQENNTVSTLTNNNIKADQTIQYIDKNDLTNTCLLEDSLIKKNHDQKIIGFRYPTINTNELDFLPHANEVLKHNGFLYFAVYIPTSIDSTYNIYYKNSVLYKYDCTKKIGKNIVDFGEGHPYHSVQLNTFSNNILKLSYVFPDAS